MPSSPGMAAMGSRPETMRPNVAMFDRAEGGELDLERQYVRVGHGIEDDPVTAALTAGSRETKGRSPPGPRGLHAPRTAPSGRD